MPVAARSWRHRAPQALDLLGIEPSLAQAVRAHDRRHGALEARLGDEVRDAAGVVLDPILGETPRVDPHPGVDLALSHASIEVVALRREIGGRGLEARDEAVDGLDRRGVGTRQRLGDDLACRSQLRRVEELREQLLPQRAGGVDDHQLVRALGLGKQQRGEDQDRRHQHR
jgi:hypothetical protein